MFNNVGRKIKGLAVFFAWVGIIVSLIAGIGIFVYGSQITDNIEILGIVLIIVGPIASWLSSLALYGFGQLIENSDIIAERIDE